MSIYKGMIVSGLAIFAGLAALPHALAAADTAPKAAPHPTRGPQAA